MNATTSTRPRPTPSAVTKWDPGLTERVMGWLRPADQGLPPRRGARPRRLPAGWRAGRRQPLRRPVRHGRPGVRDRLLREVRLRPAGLHAQPRHHLHRTDRRLLPQDRLHPRQPRERRRGAALRRRRRRLPRRRLRRVPADAAPRTRSTSTAAPATCGPRSTPGVPIVPAVSIGGQEAQLFLSRGEWLAKAVRLDKLLARQDPAHLLRLPVRPVGRASR